MNKTIKIADISSLNASSLTSKDYIDEILYLDTGSITRNTIHNIQRLEADKDSFPSRAKRKVSNNTIIYSTVRPIQEHYGFLENPSKNLIVSTGFTTIDVDTNEAIPKFIYYLLTQKYVTEHLQKIAENSVSSYPSINPSDIGNLEFEVPSLIEDQQKIVDVLSNIDDKIKVNTEVNDQLQLLLKTLFQYWFIQFEFPNSNGEPYQASGGEMVYSKDLRRKIPKGWSAEPISNLVKLNTNTVNPEKFGDNLFKLYSIPVYDDTGTYSIEPANTIGSNKFTVDSLDILVSKLNPKFNRVIFASDESNQICSTEFVVWSCPDLSIKNFLYLIATSDEFIAYCIQSATGTSNSHNRVNPNIMLSFKLPFEKSIVEKFGMHINPIIKKINMNNLEIVELRKLRDWLLPMLMNGQVTVKS